ncbi:amidohydrolase family protein [Rhizobium sp. NRK18]|uniref:amidohydrolase family protein n=1 Tax=Rhizobium sp. NRK18 TaxID=2964667 RepID=UPI0021C44C9E|nr:amidohydrolase family protein [Rhizobium sp. NRK18]MCQ2003219.1 amidohydrolase family protein [Rhizobium sp. NRK18]
MTNFLTLTKSETTAVWDAHFHILDGAAPVSPLAVLPNKTASIKQYRRMATGLGLTHGVIVQPSIYGTDNGVTLRALEELGPNYRAICVIKPDCEPAILARWHGLGVRGVRFNQVQAGATDIQDLPRISELISEFGWHVQLHIKADFLERYSGMLRSLKTPLVLDHLGRCTPTHTADRKSLTKLFESDHVWVKLSGPYHEPDADGSYEHSRGVAKSLVAVDPTRLVWGSDWPHVTERQKPSMAKLAGFVEAAAGSESNMRQILSLNPSRLYK